MGALAYEKCHSWDGSGLMGSTGDIPTLLPPKLIIPGGIDIVSRPWTKRI